MEEELKELEKLKDYDNEEVSMIAGMVLEMFQEYKNGNVTKGQMQEIIRDLENLEAIDKLASSIEDKSEAASIVGIFKAAFSIIPIG